MQTPALMSSTPKSATNKVSVCCTRLPVGSMPKAALASRTRRTRPPLPGSSSAEQTRRTFAGKDSPATAPTGAGPLFHHIGLYAYRREALERFVNLPPSPLEKRERLEQLRALEDGMRIDVALVDTVPLGVDTAADLEVARRLLAPAD